MLTKAEIREVRSLADKRGRDESGLFVAEGAKLVDELCRSEVRIRRIYTTAKGRFEHYGATAVSGVEMERLSLLKTPSDALAVAEIPQHRFDISALEGKLTLALDDVQNPGNLGTLIRLADWFGISDIICSPATADCYNPKVVQATMGAILRVRVHYVDLPTTLSGARGRGLHVYGTFLEGDDIHTAPLSADGIVVFGNEGQGISARCAASVDRRIFIPPYPPARNGSESLNVAMAAAIVCAEFRRRVR